MTVRKLAAVTATLALALALGACGDKKDNATSDPQGTPSATGSADAEPKDSPTATAPAGEITYTSGDAKAAFNTFFQAVAAGDGSVLCGYLDDGTLAAAPAGFDCPTMLGQVFAGSEAELKAFAGIKVTSVSTSGDKTCVSLKDLNIDPAALAALMGNDQFDATDDTPMCMTKTTGHWTIVEDTTSN